MNKYYDTNILDSIMHNTYILENNEFVKATSEPEDYYIAINRYNLLGCNTITIRLRSKLSKKSICLEKYLEANNLIVLMKNLNNPNKTSRSLELTKFFKVEDLDEFERRLKMLVRVFEINPDLDGDSFLKNVPTKRAL